MTLEQIKDEVAKEFGYDDEKHFYDCAPIDKCVEYVNEVCKRYATACVKASQERILKSARINLVTDSIPEGTKVIRFTNAELSLSIDELSITNPDNIVLL